MRISPVTRWTAIRKPWVLDVTLRGEPYALRASVNRTRVVARRRASSASENAGVTAHDPSSSIEQSATSTPVCDAANARCGRAARRRPLDGVAGDEQSGAGECAGVETGAVGVGLHKVNACRCGAQLVRGDLHVRGRGALAEFDSADGDLVDTVVAERGPARPRCARSAARSRAMNWRCRCRSASRRRAAGRCRSVVARSAASTRSMHCASPSSVNATSSGSSRSTAARHRAGRCCGGAVPADPCRARRPARAWPTPPRTPAESCRIRAARHWARCWCRRHRRRISCWGSGRSRSRRRRRTVFRRRGCRRRRCWTHCGTGTR